MSPRAHDPGYADSDSKGAKPFTASEATGATAEVTYKKRPFGIIRYAPGQDQKSAMVMESYRSHGTQATLRVRPSPQASRAAGLS